ncbi:MAG: PIN domain-containing protein [Xanthomonadales bacterium]|nr:PIN domain-containing protein [Xanthomonadales bacterium]MCB1642984.1 PIN domain-containing protein [Xanthomonadales bacterium]
MSRRVAIIDTNVVVAGLLTNDPSSPVARILDGMLAAEFTFVISEALLAEYRVVLLRPALRKQHRLSVAEVDRLLAEVALHATVLASTSGPAAPDPGDQFLWDLLHSRPDLYLVTGDLRLREDAKTGDRVLSPRVFVDYLESQSTN